MEVKESAVTGNGLRWMSDTWRSRNPVMSALISLVAAHCIINLVIIIFSDPRTSAFYFAYLYSQVIAYSDSWVFMNHALEYLHSPEIRHLFSNHTVYQVIFFDQQLKFQYPLTSLVLLEPLRLASGGGPISDNVLNLISWVVLFCFAVVVLLIFRAGIRRYVSEPFLTAMEKKGFIFCGVILVFTFYPVLEAFDLGQIQTWINFLFALAVLCWLHHWKRYAGICVGLICLMKPQFLLFLLWSAVRKQWRFAAGVVMMLILFGGISVAMYGWQNNVDYVRVVSYIGHYGESCYANQSFNGLLHRILFNGNNLQWDEHRYAPYQPVVFYGTIFTSVILIGVGLFKWKRNDNKYGEIIDFCIGALCFTMASPIAWGHHYGVLLPVLAIAGPIAIHHSSTKEKKNSVGPILLGLSYILLSNNFDFLKITANSYLNIFQSYVLIGALLLLLYLVSLQRSNSFQALPHNPN